MKRHASVWVMAAALAALVAVAWSRAPGAAWAVLGLAASVGCVWAAARGRAESWRVLALAGAAAALVSALVAAFATSRLARLSSDWPAAREALVTGASARLGGELDGALERARTLAERSVQFLGLPPEEAFARLPALVPADGPASGVVLFDARGYPRAWAGLQRTAVRPDGPELSALTTPFYVWLVARRQTSAGTAVAVVLLARTDDVPAGGRALADAFAERTGVRLRFFSARTAPLDPDVFDYVLPGRTSDTLFSVRPVPPEQGAAYASALADARRLVLSLVLIVLVLAAAVAARSALPHTRTVVVAAAMGALAAAPLQQTFGPGSLFWPDHYYLRLLGPFTGSAGAVLLTGVVCFAAAASLWRRGVPPFRGRIAAAVALTLAAPYLVQALARGIAPPADGTTSGQWLVWQVALALPSAVLVLVAAALVRGRLTPSRSGWGPYAAVALATLAAAAGLWLWEPGRAWPEWYPYLWTPALLLAIRPMRFRALLATSAVVAGSSAALLVWGATNGGRMALATRDLEGLGDRADALSVALLDRLVHETAVETPPSSAGDLFLLWRRSALGVQGYPAALAVWDPAAGRTIALDLAELDLPREVVGQVAREAREEALPLVRPLLRVPGLYGIAAIPLADGRVLTVVVGPRSRLVAPTRLARFLVGEPTVGEPPYDIALAPPGQALAGGPVQWQREGWLLRGERMLDLPDGPRHVHALVDLRGPSALLQRGLLVLAFDVLVLVALFAVLETAAGRMAPGLRAWWPQAHRSLRVRLSVSLALFFIVPTVGFAAWSFGRLEEEFRGARALLLQRTLRDAAADLDQEGGRDDPAALLVAARQVDAELMVSHGGVVRALSAPVLNDLGLADVLVPGVVMRRLAWGDELESAEPQAAAPVPTLVGYRLFARRDPGEAAILAAPELLSDRALRRRESDLAVAVLVGVVLGLIAAIVLSGAAARALARPLEALRRAALDVATGAVPTVSAGDMPAELEPIRGALAQAAGDVEKGQRAQRVLAWGEMARQVAHEIKNPLTPIRLGIQHLLRVQTERPFEIERVLPETGSRILAEIDRLDGIARSFSRFALPGAEGMPVDAVALAAVVEDVARLYRIGEGGLRCVHTVPLDLTALARRDELVEVLVNLCENARDAGSRSVSVTARAAAEGVVLEVADDGRGIAPGDLPRVFEPRFSTTTSGSGLGLAIAKRLVEGWGGRIAIAASGPTGTLIRLDLRAVPA